MHYWIKVYVYLIKFKCNTKKWFSDKVLYIAFKANLHWGVARSSPARLFVCFIAPRSCRAEVCTSAELPDATKQNKIVRGYSWQLLSVDWPLASELSFPCWLSLNQKAWQSRRQSAYRKSECCLQTLHLAASQQTCGRWNCFFGEELPRLFNWSVSDVTFPRNACW